MLKFLEYVASLIRINDTVFQLTEDTKNLNAQVNNIDNRLIHIEILVEIAEKQRRPFILFND